MRLVALCMLASGCGRFGFDGGVATDASGSEVARDTLEQDAAAPLVDRGAVVRYFLDEAAAGASETIVRDALPDPFDLTIMQVGDDPAWIDSATGRGLSFDTVGDNAGACRDLEGKPLTQLDGRTEATIEVVAAIAECHPNGARFAHIGSSSEWRFSLGCRDTGVVEFQFNGPAEGTGPGIQVVADVAQRHVYTLVMETATPVQGERMRLYIDGVRQLDNGATFDALQNAALDLGAPLERTLCIGNRKIGAREPRGVIAYMAMYNVALSESELAENATRLLANDDR